MRNVLSIDVEDYFQVHALETQVRRAEWGSYPRRVEANTRRVLRILCQEKTRATFFVLGWIADRHPNLVAEIAEDGHEIASHGYWHELIYQQTPQEFGEDISQALEALRRALDGGLASSVLGYRAPSFSITRESMWALDVLCEHGFRYDSSIFPLLAHDRYGIPDANRFLHRLGNGLWEVPISTIRFLGRNWPVAGGGYFRLYPFDLTCWAIQRINREGYPAVVYVHPWEFDPEQPTVPGLGAVARFRHYVNLSRTETRLRCMLRKFEFGPVCEVFDLG